MTDSFIVTVTTSDCHIDGWPESRQYICSVSSHDSIDGVELVSETECDCEMDRYEDVSILFSNERVFDQMRDYLLEESMKQTEFGEFQKSAAIQSFVRELIR